MTEAIIIDGINKSLRNADALIEEANILKDRKKLERAYFLFQISIEEVGKAQLLFDFLLKEDFKDKVKCIRLLKNYRSHPLKTKMAIGINTLIARTIKDKDLRLSFIDFIAAQYENVKMYDDFKNFSLYTNYKFEAFHLPSTFIDERILNQIKFFAENISLVSNQTIPALIKSLSAFRPSYQKAIKSMTPEKYKELISKLREGEE